MPLRYANETLRLSARARRQLTKEFRDWCEKTMLSVKAAAEHAGVCTTVIRQWVASGKLAHYRLGAPGSRGKIAIQVADLDALLAACRVEKKEPEAKKRPAPLKTIFKHLKLKLS